MNKKEIANELLFNTKNIYLKDLIRNCIIQTIKIQPIKCTDKTILRLHDCISYIEKSGFDITGWQLGEIPIHDVHCFYNDKTDQCFDLVLHEGKVIPSYVYDHNQFDAESIQEAIEKFSMD